MAIAHIFHEYSRTTKKINNRFRKSQPNITPEISTPFTNSIHSFASYRRALKLQDATMQSNQPYQEAKKVMNELRQDKLSEGRSWEVIRADLRAAVLAREPVAIAATLNAFIRAEVPDTYNDVENAKRCDIYFSRVFAIICLLPESAHHTCPPWGQQRTMF